MSLIVLMVIVAASPATPYSKMDTEISGKPLASTQNDSRYDPKKKLFLYSSNDCDGWRRRLILCADLRTILLSEDEIGPHLGPEQTAERYQYWKSTFALGKVTPTTNKGVTLGMTRLNVESRLGAPTRTLWSKKFNAQELIYSRRTRKDATGNSTRFSNYYLFKNGKLYYIELASDEDLGC